MKRKKSQFDFRVLGGSLQRVAVLSDGRTYTHKCSLEALKEVCYYLDKHADRGVVTSDLWEHIPYAAMECSVALAFLKERGLVVTEGRRNYPASTVLFEDAMVNYYAMAEGVG
jgi:hypothetical protein